MPLRQSRKLKRLKGKPEAFRKECGEARERIRVFGYGLSGAM